MNGGSQMQCQDPGNFSANQAMQRPLKEHRKAMKAKPPSSQQAQQNYQCDVDRYNKANPEFEAKLKTASWPCKCVTVFPLTVSCQSCQSVPSSLAASWVVERL
jgi:hypothetical protein